MIRQTLGAIGADYMQPVVPACARLHRWRQGVRGQWQRHEINAEPTPMDVGAIFDKGKGKSKGKRGDKKDRC